MSIGAHEEHFAMAMAEARGRLLQISAGRNRSPSWPRSSNPTFRGRPAVCGALGERCAMPVVLRPATLADAPRLASLLIDTRAAFMPYAPSAHSDAEVRAWVASHLVPAGGVTVAQADGRIVAAMAVATSDGVSWITQMAVDPAWVGRGIGARLLAHALRRLPLPVRLYTFQANAGARRFYERHGFAAIAFSDGQANEERCPDVLYEFAVPVDAA